MLFHPEYPEEFLVELADLRRKTVPEFLSGHLKHLQRIVSWAEDYLTQPHPELGRDGPVCPFVALSMRYGLFYLTVKSSRNLTREGIEATLRRYRDWFCALEPTEGQKAIFKTILCIFPDLPPAEVPRLIDGTQVKLRPHYVREGLMIGEFHDGPPVKSGLWNTDFRPLRSPLPMLVIRHMVPTDFAFLRGEKELLAMYLERFPDSIPAHLRQEVARAAREHGLDFPDLHLLEAVHPRVIKALSKHKRSFVVHRHRDLPIPIAGPHDVARALGYELGRISKSLFLRDGDTHYAIALCSVDRELDLSRIARALGCKRLELANREELASLLGFSPGGVSPLGVGREIPVFVDEGLMAYPTILTAAGEVSVEIEISPKRLCEVTDASVMPITKETVTSEGSSRGIPPADLLHSRRSAATRSGALSEGLNRDG